MRIATVDVSTLAQNWWALLIRGIAAVIFGVLTFVSPGISLVALVLLFGAYSFADGIFAIMMAIRRRGVDDHWWLLVVEGLVGLAVAAVTWFYPGLTALALLYLVAAWAIVTGGLEIGLAIRLRKAIPGEWLLALSGLVSIVLGVALVLFPGPGTLALVIWIGAYALVFGAVLIGLSFKLHAWAKLHEPPGTIGQAHGRPTSA